MSITLIVWNGQISNAENSEPLLNIYNFSNLYSDRPLFRSSVIQMSGSYYLPGKKIVVNLSATQTTIRITDHLIIGLLSTIKILD